MSESKWKGPIEVYGAPQANGRLIWSYEIKAMAAERVAAGATVTKVARELTANKSLVGRLVRDLRGDKPARQAKAEWDREGHRDLCPPAVVC